MKIYWLLIPLFLLLLSSCASVPRDYPRMPSTAYRDYLGTSAGKLFEEAAVQHPGESGFSIIRHGRQAFTARIALTELAEKSLDLQYYIWEPDATGKILAERLIKVADQGVTIRILVDDINLTGRDAMVAAMDAHPNIEIRIFNPFASRSLHILDFLTDMDRVNHRMHNKIMVMDNAVALLGGRNIGNHYFEVATDANFRDLDIAAAGPVVREISDVFDYFWNSDWAVPIAALIDHPYTEADVQTLSTTLREQIAVDNYPYPLDADINELRSELFSIRDSFIWAPGKIIWNDPANLQKGVKDGAIAKALSRKFDMLQDELLIESAYFVPVDSGIETIKKLKDRGVNIRIMTNSLASNDVVAAHAGYAKRREKIIENGAALYEMRPDAGTVNKHLVLGTSKAALHTKASVFDRESVYIGSYNLDQRSRNINTEAGLYVESPELAEQVIAYMDEGILPENSYRVLLDEDGDLVWVTTINDQEVRYHSEPEAGFWNRFMSSFIQLLPIEDQL